MSYDAPHGPPLSGPPESIDGIGGDRIIRPPGGRRGLLIGVGAVAIVGIFGASWAAWSFFSTGAQPAEALPGSTVAYVSVDLDPSGGQKIEALRTLSKFPAFKEYVGLNADDDIREWIFDLAQGDCDGLDYSDDVEPWLGDRFAVAAVDVDSADVGDVPAPVFVLQVSDEDGADAGLEAIRDCNGAGPDEGAWVIQDGWVVVAETQEIVDQVADQAAKSPLSDDEDYRHWTGEVGDSGVIALYAAPEAGKLLAEEMSASAAAPDDYGWYACVPGEEQEPDSACAEAEMGDTIPVLPEVGEATKALEDFRGAAATIRFDDGGVEFEVAADSTAVGKGVTGGGSAGAVVSSLPEDTIAAVGLSLGAGWFDDVLDQVAQMEDLESVDELLAEASSELGITLPEDAETLVGEALALAIGPDFDPDTFFGTPPSGLPGVGVKVLGDPDKIDSVLDKLRTAVGSADEGVLNSDSSSDAVAVGSDADYRQALLDDGGLGGTSTFHKVIDHVDDAAVILYVDLDAGADWVSEFAGDNQELWENLEPLDALGLSFWQDDESVHAVLKITSD